MTNLERHNMIPVKELAGKLLPSGAQMPSHRSTLSKWLKRHGVEIVERRSNGGLAHFVRASDLPGEAQCALLDEPSCMSRGQYDDDAWRKLYASSGPSQERARHRGRIAEIAVPMNDRGVTWREIGEAIASELDCRVPSESTLRTICKACEGVEPANYAPALLDNYKGGGAAATMSETAWKLFLSDIYHAPARRPRKAAWRRVQGVAMKHGWNWPSYDTVNRRWNELSELERRSLKHKHGGFESLYKHQYRDTSHLLPLDEVSMDGRKLDVWVERSGRIFRPHIIGLTDVASRRVIGWRFTETENAQDTAYMILEACDRHGIFDMLRTDNSRAFAGKVVSGGAKHRHRGKVKEGEAPGLILMLGADIGFAIPANGQAKPIERAFRDMSENIDTEFGSACASKADGDTPHKDVLPVLWDDFVTRYTDGIHRYNAQTNRR